MEIRELLIIVVIAFIPLSIWAFNRAYAKKMISEKYKNIGMTISVMLPIVGIILGAIANIPKKPK